MLMAILYRDEQILAAAYACDQHAFGNDFWTEIKGLDLPDGAFEFDVDGIYETAYVSVANLQLRERLLNASRDEDVNLALLTEELESSLRPKYLNRAA